ncbi:MAG: phenylalanine--tRNA ligase subunit beta [Acidobacteria bacterium]|jgi:phenylalanyl-tRNA synthetase beta chain|nr:phenylalanine--tRNA ligase subunit beta [Acidobacteriota bacterium]
MNISYNWLKDLVEIDLSPQELATKLTNVGLAVEGIHEAGDDYVFDIDLTSNRSDCLSHLGVSREVAAITNYELQITNYEDLKSKIENQRLVSIQDSDLCNRFTARIIKNVKIGESPDWLKQRLEAVGERSINNVADITNFVMHELGQPMHSFDLNKLKENRIVVRRARNGETIRTLDESERKLDETMLAICDAEKPVAVGGVMGGFESGITNETTDVLLEVAYFDRANIRQTSRNLKLSTEASHRFERGVDIENLIRASNRATELICDLAGGAAENFVDVYPTKFQPNEIESNDIQAAVKRLTGLDVAEIEILKILKALGFEVKDKSPIANRQSQIFLSPSWRHDVAIEEDLVEEVARIVGYDKIAEELPTATSAGEYQPTEPRKKSLRNTLAALGFDEAISYSFIDTRNDGKFGLIPKLVAENLDEKFVTLEDSIIEGATRMRPSLLSGLLDAVRSNLNHRKRDLKLFEIGKVFSASEKENDLPNERELFALVLTGNETLQNKTMPLREFDFYDAKGAMEAAVSSLNLSSLVFEPKNVSHLRRGQSAEISLNGKAVGTIGQLSDEIASVYKFRQPVFVAEVDLQTLLESKEQTVVYRPLPVYPSIVRDVSLLVKRSVSFAEIKNAIVEQNFELLRSVEFVDVYEGKGVASDERSITIRLEYRSNERTLLDEEVDAIHAEILQNIETNLGAKQRF